MIQRRMRPQEIVKVDKSCNQAIGTIKRTKASARLIPCFQLVIKRFDEVIRNDFMEVFNSDMFRMRKKQFDRLFIGKISVRDNSRTRSTKLIFATLNQAECTVRVAIR